MFAARVLEIELDTAVEDDEEVPTETAGRGQRGTNGSTLGGTF